LGVGGGVCGGVEMRNAQREVTKGKDSKTRAQNPLILKLLVGHAKKMNPTPLINPDAPSSPGRRKNLSPRRTQLIGHKPGPR